MQTDLAYHVKLVRHFKYAFVTKKQKNIFVSLIL
jgi:hypothetical protein